MAALNLFIVSRLMSEKLDGIRGYWDGTKLLSKQGNEIVTPDYFVEDFPSFPLEGELWLGRGTFDILRIKLRTPKEEDWENIQFMIFDLPNSKETFESRRKELKQLSLPAHAKVIDVEICRDESHMEQYLDLIMKNGGEGVILNDPKSFYTIGLTSTILKVKVCLSHLWSNMAQRFQDTEVRLLEILPTGLKCEQQNGEELIVSCFFQVLKNPPSIGSVLTVKHSGYYQNGKLKHPYFWRERTDINWDIISDLNHPSRMLAWAANANWIKKKNQYEFFQEVSKKIGIKEISDWYQVTANDIRNYGGGGLLASLYNNSLCVALQSIYPQHKWIPWKMKPVPLGFWKIRKNQKEFVEWAAKELGLKSISDWYNIRREDIIKLGGTGLLDKVYGGSPSKLLQSVYPDHDWILWKFKQVPSSFWKDKKNQRKFMDWLAKRLNIRKMEDWYQVKTEDFVTNGGGYLLDKYYSGYVLNVLHGVYPEEKWNLSQDMLLNCQLQKPKFLNNGYTQLLNSKNDDSAAKKF